jgi:hypothetical protein
MAKYDYNALRDAAQQRKRIGGWEGYDVYTCSKYDYDPSSSYFWVIYDDDKVLVREGQVYGTISSNGQVDKCIPYAYFIPKKKNKMPAEDKRSVPATAYSAYVAGAKPEDTQVAVDVEDFFVRIDKEINELLANADKVDLSVSFGVDV